MQIEIDQSWKIEDTNKKSVIAFSNSTSASLLISAKEKKAIQQLYRQAGKPEIFVYRLFSVLIFILVKDYLEQVDSIVVDTEYPGKEALIKDFILQLIWKYKDPSFNKNKLWFKQIGKRSRAHKVAYATFKESRRCTESVGLKDIAKYLL